jgi:hypothetical protein
MKLFLQTRVNRVWLKQPGRIGVMSTKLTVEQDCNLGVPVERRRRQHETRLSLAGRGLRLGKIRRSLNAAVQNKRAKPHDLRQGFKNYGLRAGAEADNGNQP